MDAKKIILGCFLLLLFAYALFSFFTDRERLVIDEGAERENLTVNRNADLKSNESDEMKNINETSDTTLPLQTNESRYSEKTNQTFNETNSLKLSENALNWIEGRIHALANLERENMKMEKLSYDEKLEEIAQKHSKDMVERNFFDHVNPDGQSPSVRTSISRYQCIRKKYECEGTRSVWKGYYCKTHIGEDRGKDETKVTRHCNDGYCVTRTTKTYATPGIKKTTCEESRINKHFKSHRECKKFYDDYFIQGVGESIGMDSVKHNTTEELAQSIFSEWLNSSIYRENILNEIYEKQGIGVAVSDEGKVLVTQNFC